MMWYSYVVEGRHEKSQLVRHTTVDRQKGR